MKTVLARLRRAYGAKPKRRWGNGVEVLVETILSQNTSDVNSSRAYERLRRRFKTWQAVAEANTEEVEHAIRVAGLSRMKAPRIQQILRQIRTERARISLEFLQRWEPKQAADYLRQFKGIGPKTVNCILLFAFGMPVFPVDTHIHRIAKRMGWIKEKVNAEQAHTLLEPMILPKDRYEMHVLLIRHGRETCKAARPMCEKCVVREVCAYGRKRFNQV